MSKNIKIKMYSNLPSVSTHFTLTEFQIVMQRLHLHLGVNQVPIYSVNLVQDVFNLM